MSDSNEDGDLFHAYVAILAAKQFKEENGRAPGLQSLNTEDIQRLETIAHKIVHRFGGKTVSSQTTKVIEEM